MANSPRRAAQTGKSDGAASAVETATLRVAPLRLLPDVLRDFGLNPMAVLGQAGFDPSHFSDADALIPYAGAIRLLAHCAAATGCEHLGLLLAERAGAEALGLPGLLLVTASDVGAGLREVVHYWDLHDRGAVVSLEQDADTALLGYTILSETEGADHGYDVAIGIARNIMRILCGERWSPSEVLLRRQQPEDASPWRSAFRAPVRFGAARCAIKFPARWLSSPLPATSSALHGYLRGEADRLQSALGKNLVAEVRRTVKGMATNSPCSASLMARMLGMQERTLNRRLHAHGTSFRQLRDEVLHDMARQMLGVRSARVVDVSAALGYAEASAFIRAFKRWSGQTPDQWRRESGWSPTLGQGRAFGGPK